MPRQKTKEGPIGRTTCHGIGLSGPHPHTLNAAHAAYPGALVTNEYIAFTKQRDSAFHSRYRFYGG
jgi:hypothetical protein